MKRQPRDTRDYTDWTKEDFENDLRTNPRYQDFYKNYAPESIENFILYYASSKYSLYQNKMIYYENADYERSKFLLEAERFLTVILHKKLFNLQCLWRAEMIDLPMIEYTRDFEYFIDNIWDCPYIEPITEEELDLAIRFLLEEQDFTYPDFTEWQDYNCFKVWDTQDDEDDEERDTTFEKLKYYDYPVPIPDFYTYYDNYFKTSHLFNLPDKRWAKEKYYFDAIRDENARLHAIEQAKQKDEPPPPPAYTPSLYGYGSDKEDFIASCEDETTKELFAMSNNHVSLNDFSEWSESLKFLLELRNKGETFALVPHTDWHDAIIATAAQIRRKKTAEMLPYAYQTYMLEFEDEDIPTLMARRLARFKFDDTDRRNRFRKSWRADMDQGRALRGE